MIYYQNGVQTGLKDAEKGAQLLKEITGQKVGIINNKTAGEDAVGLTGDLIEYAYNGLELKDALNAKVYEDIVKNGDEKNTIILFSAGNRDAQKAMEVLALEKRSLDNKIEFISVGSPVSKEKLDECALKVNASIIGQYNTPKDPVANAMGWVSGTSGLAATGLLIGTGIGAAIASGAGPMAAYGGALVGGGVGGGVLLYSLNKYHSLENYFKNDVKGLRSTVEKLGEENK